MIADTRVSPLLIVASLGIAFVLVMLPLPAWAVNWRPAFYVITALFWVLMQPRRFGLVAAWCCGLLIDVLYGSPLGQHALALAIPAYAIIRLREWLWLSPYWQQALLLLPVLGLYEFVLFWIDGILGHDVTSLRRWLPIVASSVIWPFWAMLWERIAETGVRP